MRVQELDEYDEDQTWEQSSRRRYLAAVDPRARAVPAGQSRGVQACSAGQRRAQPLAALHRRYRPVQEALGGALHRREHAQSGLQPSTGTFHTSRALIKSQFTFVRKN